MPELFRVVVWRDDARPGEEGHPLYLPVGYQGQGRIDNPDLYTAFYLSTDPAGAIAEAFGNLGLWSEQMFSGPPRAPGTSRALVAFRTASTAVLDLDDPAALLERSLRPSRVVTRDRAVTQAWARRIHAEGRWMGVSWWSYYDPRWTSVGLWDSTSLTFARIERLDRRHAAVNAAGQVLCRVWV